MADSNTSNKNVDSNSDNSLENQAVLDSHESPIPERLENNSEAKAKPEYYAVRSEQMAARKRRERELTKKQSDQNAALAELECSESVSISKTVPVNKTKTVSFDVPDFREQRFVTVEMNTVSVNDNDNRFPDNFKFKDGVGTQVNRQLKDMHEMQEIISENEFSVDDAQDTFSETTRKQASPQQNDNNADIILPKNNVSEDSMLLTNSTVQHEINLAGVVMVPEVQELNFEIAEFEERRIVWEQGQIEIEEPGQIITVVEEISHVENENETENVKCRSKQKKRFFANKAKKLKSSCSKIKKKIVKLFRRPRVHPLIDGDYDELCSDRENEMKTTFITKYNDVSDNEEKMSSFSDIQEEGNIIEITQKTNYAPPRKSFVCFRTVSTEDLDTITADQYDTTTQSVKIDINCDGESVNKQSNNKTDNPVNKSEHDKQLSLSKDNDSFPKQKETTVKSISGNSDVGNEEPITCEDSDNCALVIPKQREIDVNDRFISLLSSIPLVSPSQNICITGHINGKQVTLLIDTGANVSAIKAEVWQQIPPLTKHPPLPTPIAQIKAVNGQTIPVIGQVQVPFTIDDKTYPFDVLIIETIAYDVILGRDFLEQYNAKIDLQHRVLELQLDPVPFESMETSAIQDREQPGTCSIHAKSSFILPPRSEVIVPGELGHPWGQEQVGLVEPRADLTQRYQVIGAAQIVKAWEGTTVPIRLLNPTEQPVKIYRRTRLGEFVIVDPEIATYELLQSDLEAEAGREVPTALDSETRAPHNIDMTQLDQSQQARLQALLERYNDIFAYTPDQLGRCSIVKHTIDTEGHPPIRLRSYRTSPANKEEIDKQINEMLDNDVISPSVSPWAAPVVLVKKSDGTMRFCVDYRKLNSITRKDSHPLPRISEALDALGGANYFTTLDLRSGYWQIQMEEGSKEKTAFITHNGLYEFNVLPFGLCNSPATFQRLMTHVLRGLEWDICLVYIDDLIIFSRTFDDHLLHLERVFKRLRDANVRLKPSKCYFVQQKVDYLGHVVSAEGLSPNPNKIQAVQDFPIPQNTTGIKAFLGLCNYYRRFIKDFAQIASPLNKLTSKNAKFHWTADCQRAFDTLKRALVSAPVLSYPDFSLPFHLYVDASQTGIGLTLGQIVEGKEVVIAYAGRDFNQAERNYSATEREALAVIDGIKRFQSYLYGRRFYIHTDHSALKWLMSIQDPTGRLARWSLLIQQFDFEIIHRPGKSNGNADALSRRSYGTCDLNAISSAGLQTERISEFQRKDPDLFEIIDYLENDLLPSDNGRAKRGRYKIVRNLLCRRKCSYWTVIATAEVVFFVMQGFSAFYEKFTLRLAILANLITLQP